MTQTSRNGGRPPASTQELRAEVEHARDELADTVSQLAAKADIKSRARLRAKETRAKVQHQGRHAADQDAGRQGAIAAAGAGALALIVLAAILYRQRHT